MQKQEVAEVSVWVLVLVLLVLLGEEVEGMKTMHPVRQ